MKGRVRWILTELLSTARLFRMRLEIEVGGASMMAIVMNSAEKMAHGMAYTNVVLSGTLARCDNRRTLAMKGIDVNI
jgi:hypothetical protein